MPLDAASISVAPAPAARAFAAGLLGAFQRVRSRSVALAAPLSTEDQTVQSMPDASPAKWHLAHTTWFFETFVLAGHDPRYRPFDSEFGYLFNSYYEAVGARHPRPQRGLITRPSVSRVAAYREHVDAAVERLLAASLSKAAADLITLGLAHEEQHQELLLMDILNLFAASPLAPAYSAAPPRASVASRPLDFVAFDEASAEIGADGQEFAFDNEAPRHRVFLRPYRVASRLVTNGEWMEFMAAGGYRRPEFWLSDGWARVQEEQWEAPLYWRKCDGGWKVMSLSGAGPIDPRAPVCHVSFFEAAAFAVFAGARLPTEAEWEYAVGANPDAFDQVADSAWQWTSSAYGPHPGFAPAGGAVGEYNGKFMSGQMVLKGGACVTPPGHARPSYRNFYYPHQRWMFSGVRLARDEGLDASIDQFRRDVLGGLGAARKRLPAKWFYDERGSVLFERICEQPEYYPTRQEIALLEGVASEIAVHVQPGSALIEFGSGASLKTRRLLDATENFATYVPIDISDSALTAGARAIQQAYPNVTVRPLIGDFTRPQALGGLATDGPRVGFFPGSTIGNFEPARMIELLDGIRRLLGPGGILIVGVDLVKDAATLEAAYDDAAGVTAAFNLNLLERINRELTGGFDLAAFAHRAVWNSMESRMEMHLQSLRDQSVQVADREIGFTEGETIHTENSYKLSPAAFLNFARRGGWSVIRDWSSPAPSFAVFLLSDARSAD